MAGTGAEIGAETTVLATGMVIGSVLVTCVDEGAGEDATDAPGWYLSRIGSQALSTESGFSCHWAYISATSHSLAPKSACELPLVFEDNFFP